MPNENIKSYDLSFNNPEAYDLSNQWIHIGISGENLTFSQAAEQGLTIVKNQMGMEKADLTRMERSSDRYYWVDNT